MLKKPQIQNSKLQTNSKCQAATRMPPSRWIGARKAELGAYLDLGIWDSGFSFRCHLVHDTSDYPASGASIGSHGFSCCRAIGGNHHSLVQAGTVRVNRYLRHTFGLADAVDGLTNDQSPALQAGMLAGRHDIPFDAS
jgi:hypothetical protein